MGRNTARFLDRLARGEAFLTEGAVVERLRREFQVDPDEHLVFGGAIYDQIGTKALTQIFAGYMETAHRFARPILVTSSTRRSNRERIAGSPFPDRAVNEDWIVFLEALRDRCYDHRESIFIGGLLGTKGDAYKPEEALDEEAALEFHRWQCQAFRNGGADFLMAGVVPSLSEAKGLARAMEETGLPFMVSFMVNRRGRLLDGTLIGKAIAAIDALSRPCCFMVNCVHPDNLLAGLALPENRGHPSIGRLIGIQANTSLLGPGELDKSQELRCDGAETLTSAMRELKLQHHFRIFGGCCGTDGTHIEQFAAMLEEA